MATATADLRHGLKPSRADALPGVSAFVLSLHDELLLGMDRLAQAGLGEFSLEICPGRDALWLLVRRPGKGGLALRAAHAPGGCINARAKHIEETIEVRLESAIGSHLVRIEPYRDEVPILRITSTLTPSAHLLVPFLPRDLYPFDQNDDPLGAEGRVEAAQRGMNSGVCYFRMTEPAFGSVLYFQNLTSMNRYFQSTRTKPDGAVGGEWPEIGYLPPTPPQSGTPPVDPLPVGEEVTISDAFLAFHLDADDDEQGMGRRYLALLGAIYRRLECPALEFHDWVDRAERSLHDLGASRKASIRHYGFRYLHPYTASEYPDSMVQLSVLAALRDFEAWKQDEIPLRRELAAGLRKFYDPNLCTLRRYLPNVGKDKDRAAVDSWYLYHPLMNLGRLALDNDRRARNLFLQSIDFGIKAAKHFDYKWPIQFKVTDFSVITEARNDDGLGQTDVGGLYAYVMLQAFELTGDKRFLDEARTAIDAAKGMRFELNYQANLTAWGAAACMRLWRITTGETYLRQSYVYLASFFHNTAIWESEIGYAPHYHNFLGVTALHDAPYMAMYECFDSFAAFERYLKDSGPDTDPAVRLLLSEYCRYALDRAWYYYPDALPAEVVAGEIRNGHIDRDLSFPLEDLYVDGQPAGQVGQEIYGAGSAFVFASRMFHTVRDAPFRIFCDHFLLASERPSERSFSVQLGGGEGREARFSIIPLARRKLPNILVSTAAGEHVKAQDEEGGRKDFAVPADGRIKVVW